MRYKVQNSFGYKNKLNRGDNVKYGLDRQSLKIIANISTVDLIELKTTPVHIDFSFRLLYGRN